MSNACSHSSFGNDPLLLNFQSSDDQVAEVEVFLVDLSQDKPYLGSLRDGESVNDAGYFVRKGNKTVYPRKNRSIAIRIRTKEGVEGWGETYGLVAPQATASIINDLLRSFVLGRDPFTVESLHDELYNLMRVRGYTGGFYLDALAAVDIALWDIVGKICKTSVASLLCKNPANTISAYVSGLPENTLEKRCDLALSWKHRGFNSFKFALPVADDGVVSELSALRCILGTEAQIAADLHWSFHANEVIQLAKEMAADHPWFLEAPVASEEIDELAMVANASNQRIAVGEEWRTVFDARLRIDRNACHIVQPEMGHTGITQFMRIGQYAQRHQLEIIPHATIGSGIFLAASLQASAALGDVVSHEFQHSIFNPFRSFTSNALVCEKGKYLIKNSPGIGASPSEEMLKNMRAIST